MGFAAVLVTNVSGDGESGISFQVPVWESLWGNEKYEYRVQDFPKQFWSRVIFDGTINAFCREVLLCLAPVALSVVGRDDLIKDSLAIFFITRMDDIAEDRTIDQSLDDWSTELASHKKRDADVENGHDQADQEEKSSVEQRKPLNAPRTEADF